MSSCSSYDRSGHRRARKVADLAAKSQAHQNANRTQLAKWLQIVAGSPQKVINKLANKKMSLGVAAAKGNGGMSKVLDEASWELTIIMVFPRLVATKQPGNKPTKDMIAIAQQQPPPSTPTAASPLRRSEVEDMEMVTKK